MKAKWDGTVRSEVRKAEQKKRGKRGKAREAGHGWGRAKPAEPGRGAGGGAEGGGAVRGGAGWVGDDGGRSGRHRRN